MRVICNCVREEMENWRIRELRLETGDWRLNDLGMECAEVVLIC